MLKAAPGLSDDSSKPLTAEEIPKNVEALKTRMKGGRGKGARGGKDGASPSPSPSRTPSSKATSKLMRKWGDSAVSADDMAALDYSTPAEANENGHPVDVDALVSADALGKRTSNGYEVADWDFRRATEDDLPSEESILARATGHMAVSNGHSEREVASGGWLNVFSRLTGSKVLTQEDLRPVLVEMEKHLMGKNVAKDIAEKLCDAVGTALVGKKLGGLTSGYNQAQSDLS